MIKRGRILRTLSWVYGLFEKMHSPSVNQRKYALSDLNSLEIRTRRP